MVKLIIDRGWLLRELMNSTLTVMLDRSGPVTALPYLFIFVYWYERLFLRIEVREH